MAKRASVDHSVMHQMNLALILNTLRLHAPVSRARLAALTGLNKATISSMVRDLLAGGFVRELGTDPAASDVGRPAINLELDPTGGYLVGAEIGVDFIAVSVTNFAVEVLVRRRESTVNTTQADILARTLELVRECIAQAVPEGGRLFGLGVGVPGLVDQRTGTLLFAPNLQWRDVPLRELFERELRAAGLDVPVYVANEANMAALGESYFGAGRDHTSLVYVSSGVGLGGGIVLGETLLSGASGFAGEIGHMTVKPDGPRCRCGNVGCWEMLATQRALCRHIQEAVAAGRTTTLKEAAGCDPARLTVDAITEAARAGDAVARDALVEVGRWLGIGIANLINAINPHAVVFGGPLSIAHEFLLPVITEEVQRRALFWSRQRAEILLAAHQADAAVMGGIAMIHHDVIRHPLRWLVA
ncbi:MAG: ROK family transcriptional regulator [Anaerolineae bacterium]|nr:ROK family transcriptional regulator [Anaerolineae bacterium]